MVLDSSDSGRAAGTDGVDGAEVGATDGTVEDGGAVAADGTVEGGGIDTGGVEGAIRRGVNSMVVRCSTAHSAHLIHNHPGHDGALLVLVS